MKTLFKDTLKVVNVGLAGFGDNVVAAGGESVPIAWQPPALGDRDAAWALAQIFNNPAIEHANQVAFARFLEAFLQMPAAIPEQAGAVTDSSLTRQQPSIVSDSTANEPEIRQYPGISIASRAYDLAAE